MQVSGARFDWRVWRSLVLHGTIFNPSDEIKSRRKPCSLFHSRVELKKKQTFLRSCVYVCVHMCVPGCMEGGCAPACHLCEVTQCPTCQIATLYTHWCRMRTGLISTALLSGSPFPIPTFRPAKLVTWQPVILNGRNPFTPGANNTP